MEKRYQPLLIFFLIIGVVAIGISFYVQYGMEIPPCIYCKMQRWGYFLLVPFSIMGLLIRKKRGMLRFIQGLLMVILWFAAVHTFKEFFGSACSCLVGAMKWEIFGVTASLYSAISSIALFVMVQYLLKKNK